MEEPEVENVAWLTPDQLREWKSLIALMMTLPTALECQLKRDAELNVFEYHVLAALSDAPDQTLRLSQLARIAQGSLSRLSHAVSRLERAGWVQRCTAHDVAHRSVARLTPAGLRRLQEVAPGHVREARRLVVDSLSAEQLAALGSAARVILAEIDPQFSTD